MTNITDYAPEFCELDESDEFSVEEISDGDYSKLPDLSHRMIQRKILYGKRDIDDFIQSINNNLRTSLTVNFSVSGQLNIGHLTLLYFVKYLQEELGSHVYIFISDDQMHFKGNNKLQTTQGFRNQILRDIIAVNFNSSKTRIIVNSIDSDIMYPISTYFGSKISDSVMSAIQNDVQNIGQSYYPAIQFAQILLPQLVYGEHPTVSISGIGKDPYVRSIRDIIDKSNLPISKPAGLYIKYLNSIKNKNSKMNSSENSILTNDTHKDIKSKIMNSTNISEENVNMGDFGGEYDNIESNYCYNLLYYFFEESNNKLIEMYDDYESGNITEPELKDYTSSKVCDFIEEHNARKELLNNTMDEYKKYRLNNTERQSSLTRLGYNTDCMIN